MQFLGAVSASLLVSLLRVAGQPKRLPTRKLGRTGINVPVLGFGSGSRFLMYQDEDEAIAALNLAIDLGITYIDTAHSYGDGKSEERVGRVMATRRKEVVLATKISARTADDARRQIELSLRATHRDGFDALDDFGQTHARRKVHARDTWFATAMHAAVTTNTSTERDDFVFGFRCRRDQRQVRTAAARHFPDVAALNRGWARDAVENSWRKLLYC